MFPHILGLILFLLASFFQVILCDNVETNPVPVPFILNSSILPTDLNFMPSLSNGHLGFTVFGDSIYMNGVYNGLKGDSRRARLPNWLNINANIVDKREEDVSLPTVPEIVYSMNLLEGHFEWTKNFRKYDMTIRQRVYAHRFYNRALIYEMVAMRNTSADSITIELENHPGPDTTAFDIKLDTANDGITMLRATTKQVENEHFQPQPTQIYVALSDDFKENRKKHLILEKGQKTVYYRFVLTADFEKQVALNEMHEVLSKTTNEILAQHTLHWREFWNNFQIELKHNVELAQIINAGIFYMASSLPSEESYHRNNPFFGLSPTGLGRGRLNADYEGHSFWDTEIWMLPVVTQLSNSWSRELFKYRLDHLEGAMYNANQTGYKGARFPWESAYTGTEVTNPCCPEVATQEIHISADIAVALQQFYATTFDKDWLCSSAWPLVREIASFLSSRTTWNKQTDEYHIKDVMGPDEDHEHVDDNVYTNVAFKQAFQFACFTEKLCSPDSKQSALEKWLDMSNKLFVMYDAAGDYHPQDRDYQPGEEVKQADTILLGYPLQFDMANSTRHNDLLMYENVTRSSGPAMTWSMFAINFLDIGIKHKADIYFAKGFEEYVRPEFKVWSETKMGYKGSANFLTGIGGYLQSIINGYAGIRFQLDNNNKSKLLIINPTALPGTTETIIKGIKFADSTFSLNVRLNGIHTFTCLHLGMYSLEVLRENMPPARMFKGFTIQFQTELIAVQTI